MVAFFALIAITAVLLFHIDSCKSKVETAASPGQICREDENTRRRPV
jgi:hypothetical protein